MSLMKILIYSPNWIGDAVMAIPMIRETRSVYPEAEITVLARDWVAPVYKFVNGIDRIIQFSRAEIKTRKTRNAIIRNVRKDRYNIAFLLTDSFSTAWTIYRANIEQRVGYTGQFRSWMLTGKIPLHEAESVHRTDKYLAELHHLGHPVSTGQSPSFTGEKIKNFPPPDHWDPVKVHIGINPNSVASSRRWPIPYWQNLVMAFSSLNAQCIMFGGPRDQSTAAEILQPVSPDVIDLTGKTSLEESIRYIAQCDLFISNDSGPMHIADAAGVPTLGLWGAGDIRHTGLRSGFSKNLNAGVYCSPCRKNQCPNIREPLICLHSLPPKLVLEEVIHFLEHGGFRS